MNRIFALPGLRITNIFVSCGVWPRKYFLLVTWIGFHVTCTYRDNCSKLPCARPCPCTTVGWWVESERVVQVYVPGVSAAMSIPFPFTNFVRTSRYVLARSGYASPVPGKMNFIRPPESKDVNGWCSNQLPSSILVCIDGTANSSLFTPSHDYRCTNAILGGYVRLLSFSFGGTGPTSGGCSSLYTFRRRCSSFYMFAWKWVCGEKTACSSSSSFADIVSC